MAARRANGGPATKPPTYRFRATVWVYDGPAAWHFLTLPVDVSAEIEETAELAPRGFGAVRVSVAIGRTIWETSIFPDKKAGAYVLPVKKAVRQAERLEDGSEVNVVVEVLAR